MHELLGGVTCVCNIIFVMYYCVVIITAVKLLCG